MYAKNQCYSLQSKENVCGAIYKCTYIEYSRITRASTG